MDMASISAVAAAAGVLFGVAYYVLDIRSQNTVRQTDMIMRLYSYYCSEEYSKASGRYLATEFKDFEDFQQKYGFVGEHPVTTAFYIVPTFFEGVGALLKRKLINIDLIHELFAVKMYWKKVEPIMQDARECFEEPRLFENFEYLYNETEKYAKKLQQLKA